MPWLLYKLKDNSLSLYLFAKVISVLHPLRVMTDESLDQTETTVKNVNKPSGDLAF